MMPLTPYPFLLWWPLATNDNICTGESNFHSHQFFIWYQTIH